MKSTDEMALQLRGIEKCYGCCKNKVEVLKQIDLDVPKGSTFCLLGPSGCGKTILLTCIVGRHRADNGTIQIFGDHLGSTKCQIPGSGVGYMPQELALVGDLTATENLEYFGRIFKIRKTKIRERINFLFEFLDLPKDWRLVGNLSAGQQRRVSFAIALLHEPRLLILDEPTIGMDPLLKKNIWKHLVAISESINTTIVVATQYIEEAMLAKRVAIMKEGRILTSGEPQSLLNRYQFSSLQEVYSHLCHNESWNEHNHAACNRANEGDNCGEASITRMLDQNLNNTVEIICQEKPVKNKPPNCQRISMPNFSKILAVTIKNFTKLRRQWHILMFQFLLPVFLITIVFETISGQPHNLKIAVVNEDNFMGKEYLSRIDSTTVHQIAVDDIKTAESMIVNGEVWGSIHIWKNFSTTLAKRYVRSQKMTTDAIRASSIHVRMDSTNILVATMVRVILVEALLELGTVTNSSFKLGFDKDSMPVQFGKSIYGTGDYDMEVYVLPGITAILVFFIAFGLTSVEFVQEKKQGLLDRYHVAGVSSIDLICGHSISHVILMIFQVGLILFFIIVVFQTPCRGNIILVILLTLSQGLCGLACGYFMATIFQNEHLLIIAGFASFFCSVIMSGIIWPLEAMPNYVVNFSNYLPQTYAIEALRNIFSRGFGIYFAVIWQGFLVSYIWISIFIILALIYIKIRW